MDNIHDPNAARLYGASLHSRLRMLLGHAGLGCYMEEETLLQRNLFSTYDIDNRTVFAKLSQCTIVHSVSIAEERKHRVHIIGQKHKNDSSRSFSLVMFGTIHHCLFSDRSRFICTCLFKFQVQVSLLY